MRLIKRIKPKLIFVISLGFLTFGCASYQTNVEEAREFIREGRYTVAAELLKPLAEKSGDDQLVYMLDYATALQLAGDFKKSNEVLISADKIADIQDYTSLSREAGSIIGAQEVVQYKGESYEKIMINAMLALNFLSLNQLDEAMVEVRRINQKLYRYKNEGGKNYEQNPFAQYLSAIIWEADKKYDDAFLAYKAAYEMDSTIPEIHKDLVRSAKLAQRLDEYKKWKSTFDLQDDPQWADKNLGELIVIAQTGWAPRKEPDPQSPRLPTLRSVYSYTDNVKLKFEEREDLELNPIYNLDRVAKTVFNEDYGALAARRFGGMVAKEVLADQVRQQNEDLGFLVWILLHITDRADLRQWSTLPAQFHISRTFLPEGDYSYSLRGISRYGDLTSDHLLEQKVEIKRGQKKFIVWRAVR